MKNTNKSPYHSNSSPKKSKKSAAGSTHRRVLTAVGIVAAVLVLICLCGYLYVDSLVTQGQAGSLTEEVVSTAPELTRKTANVLIAGIDYDVDDDGRDYSEGLGLTDVILVACCDFENNTLNLLQIPRDTYVGEEVPTGGTGKINAVYSHGPDEKNRISNLATAINDQFKLSIDYYVTLDMNAFTDLIDLLGGIEMYVPWDVTDDEGNVIHQGTQFLDSSHVEWLIRQRHMYQTADLGRLELQQYFYAAVFKTFMTFPMTDLIKIAPALVQYVNTDYSVPEIISMFAWLQSVDKANIGIARCPGGATTNINGHTGLYGINPETLAPLLNEYFRPYQDPVDASELGLPKNLTFPSGEIAAEMNYMADLSAESEE